MRGLIRGMETVPGKPGRDLRADVFRGIALWFILIDHIPGNWLGKLTLRNVALCDATEAFVLLAGYAAGLAYGAALDRRGWTFSAAALLRRLGTLYVAHVFLFVVFTAQVGYSAAALESPAYLDEMHLDVFGEQPYLALLQALLLRFQPAFLDILPLYIVLLLMLVPALPLLRRPWLLMGLSGAGYVVVRLLDLNLPNWTGGGWFFNPLAWQVLFFTGALLGYAPRRRGPAPAVPFRPLLIGAAVVALVLGLGVVLVGDYGEQWLAALPQPVAELLATIDKTGLHPFRLISILALAYLVGHAVPRGAQWLRSRAAAPFVLMGQHGLPVFCAGIFLAFLGRLALEMDDRWPMQLAVNLAGLAALVSIGVVGAWYRMRERGEAPHNATNPAPVGLRAPVGSTTTVT
ncbi:OpgC family protein [Belnapia moabensis]|uniref:OpgC family protein n=1 Tax=Belnapia moabensis TaxID=365533 RepID=UPI0006935F5D|nr:OpgC domain-containing protein [Belnapia moabensis]